MKRRFRLAIFLTAMVLDSAFFSHSPVISAVDGKPIAFVGLMKGTAYQFTSPLSETLDQLSFLSQRQHIALLTSILLLSLLWLIISLVKRRRSVAKTWLNFGTVWLIVVATYTVGALMPRPMATLIANEDDQAVVDFHSHTAESWDANSSFSVARSRQWHQDAGFDLVYITNHNRVRDAAVGMLTNPRLAGDGVSFLPGMEVSAWSQHIVLLGIRDSIGTKGFDEDSAATLKLIATAKDSGWISIASLPEYDQKAWDRVPSYVAAGINGFEIVSSAPKALDFPIKRRDSIVAITKSNATIHLTAISDTHGWGSAVYAWTVVRIAGWREMTPDRVDSVLRAKWRSDPNFSMVTVVRSSAAPADSWRTAGILFALPWAIVASLQWSERVVWLIWIWGIALWVDRRRRQREASQ